MRATLASVTEAARTLAAASGLVFGVALPFALGALAALVFDSLAPLARRIFGA